MNAMLPTPAEMVAHLDRFALGQARAKQDLAVAVYNHYLSQAYREREGRDLGHHHLLLIGPTGVGKTHLVRTLAAFLGVPIGFSSAAGLVEAGYKGNSVETMVRTLLEKAGGDPRRAERGILFVDEIDKIRRGETHGGRDVSGEGVQNALLTLLDGRLSQGLEGWSHAAVDTGRLLFICTGAFVGLADIVARRLGAGRNQIGFLPRATESSEVLSDRPVFATLCQAQTRDLVEYGMIPEFVGRFATVTVLHELSRGDLRSILGKDVERSPLEKQRRLAAIHGIELEVADDALDAIASDAELLGTGARGLHRLIGRAVDGVDGRWPDLADQGIRKVIITRACVEGSEAPRLLTGTEGQGMVRMDAELRREALAGLPTKPRPVLAKPARLVGPANTDGGGERVDEADSWSNEQIWNAIERVKVEKLGWANAEAAARAWWKSFETDSRERPALVYRVCQELAKRGASIRELFLAFRYSGTDNIQANLHYLDYMRLKEADQKRTPNT